MLHILVKQIFARERTQDCRRQNALNCGLNVEIKDLKEKFWSIAYELYVRLNNHVSTNKVAKCIESKDYSFRAKVGG